MIQIREFIKSTLSAHLHSNPTKPRPDAHWNRFYCKATYPPFMDYSHSLGAPPPPLPSDSVFPQGAMSRFNEGNVFLGHFLSRTRWASDIPRHVWHRC